eukprot:CAMPEP_0194329192 /NCGR_PEP_ID=MMETSP0171-20130528/47354_1 /TAXON_ID=218684 /ORGANISM="Corethron pennatum, Strain L29A3" /LENGTH=148 /DNA_ID=CAMNT_0039089841 /DNA_START=176 /DNA_END=622 /DNA_ORIENTATION=+
MFILALRLGIGDEMPRDPVLACKLYEAATEVERPIAGGHPVAMLHLGLHCERGIGTEQDDAQAYRWYKRVIEHEHPGEDATKHALLALSRYHATGLGGAHKSEELAVKYLAFSGSNPENAEEIKGLEKWWENPKNRETFMAYSSAMDL